MIQWTIKWFQGHKFNSLTFTLPLCQVNLFTNYIFVIVTIILEHNKVLNYLVRTIA